MHLPFLGALPLADTGRQTAAKDKWFWVAAVGIALCAGFWGLNAAGFWGRDEGRYAEIAREMVDSGDWVTPHLLAVKYFEKPPLLYWLTALSFKAFGLSSFAGRLPAVLSTLLALIAVGYLGLRFAGSAVGATVVLVLSTSMLFWGLGRALVTDMVLTGWYTVALVSLFFAFEEERPRAGRWMVLFGVSTALAVLAKGVIGIVLPVGTGVLCALSYRRLPAASWRATAVALVAFLAVALPWFVMVSARNSEFLHYFVVDQHFQRFTGGTNEHQKAWWFFPAVLAGGLLPWTGALFVRGRKKENHPPGDEGSERVGRLRRYLWLWAGVVVLFFSASGCKLAPYVLPAFPALALLIALNLAGESSESGAAGRRRAGWVAAVFWTLFAVAVMAYTRKQADLPAARVMPLAWSMVAVSLAAAVAFAGWSLRRAPLPWILLPGATAAVVWLALNGVAASLEDELGNRTVGLETAKQMQPGDLTALYRCHEPGFVYYTRQRPILFEVKNELEFGMEQQSMGDWYREGDAAFVALMRGPARVFCFTDAEQYEGAKKRYSPLYPVAFSLKRVVFSNRPAPTAAEGARP